MLSSSADHEGKKASKVSWIFTCLLLKQLSISSSSSISLSRLLWLKVRQFYVLSSQKKQEHQLNDLHRSLIFCTVAFSFQCRQFFSPLMALMLERLSEINNTSLWSEAFAAFRPSKIAFNSDSSTEELCPVPVPMKENLDKFFKAKKPYELFFSESILWKQSSTNSTVQLLSKEGQQIVAVYCKGRTTWSANASA